MKFSLVTLGLAALAVASPIAKRQNIFSNTDYDNLSISGGVAGNAEQEALDILGGLPNDLTTVSQADITFLDRVNRVANQAESGAFNPAIEAADGDEADALKVRLLAFSSLIASSLLIMTLTARQDQEQGPQAHRHHAEAADPAGAGRGRDREDGGGAEEADQQHQR